jgi:hypothetical protein
VLACTTFVGALLILGVKYLGLSRQEREAREAALTGAGRPALS